MEQTSRRSCLDDSPLANGALKDVQQKEDMELPEAHVKKLQPKDLMPSLADTPPFPVSHEPLSDATAAFESSTAALKFEPGLHLPVPDQGHAVGHLDAPIIRLDGSSGKLMEAFSYACTLSF